MTGPAVATTPACESIRTTRASVANDMLRSRARIRELSALLRAETSQYATLQLMAEITGVTDVGSDRTPDAVDAGVFEPPDAESPAR